VKSVVVKSAPHETAGVLREEILAHDGSESEWLLGSEDEVMGLLGVSRPTLRQASRILEQEQLLQVRRGIRGGLYGRRPTAQAVTRIAAVFLRAQNTTYEDLLNAEVVLGTACAERAASADPAARASLRDFYTDTLEDTPRADVPLDLFLDAAGNFQRRLAALANSPALELFVNVLMDLARPASRVADIYSDPDRRRITIARHQAVANAVYAQDAKKAATLMRKHLIDILAWTDDAARGEPLRPGESYQHS
jgi:GntR family transcriptional regulator, transcriptional repressor for pyruvate dehydrogenase complex